MYTIALQDAASMADLVGTKAASLCTLLNHGVMASWRGSTSPL